ncbi:MAG: hypothetical protein KUG83_09835 [Gammaproteobacteria bacterium]|nr:hypothetical protein [Gammaproteobacteria bacterium]
MGSVTTAQEGGFTVQPVKDVGIRSMHPNMFITGDEEFVGAVLSCGQAFTGCKGRKKVSWLVAFDDNLEVLIGGT